MSSQACAPSSTSWCLSFENFLRVLRRRFEIGLPKVFRMKVLLARSLWSPLVQVWHSGGPLSCLSFIPSSNTNIPFDRWGLLLLEGSILGIPGDLVSTQNLKTVRDANFSRIFVSSEVWAEAFWVSVCVTILFVESFSSAVSHCSLWDLWKRLRRFCLHSFLNEETKALRDWWNPASSCWVRTLGWALLRWQPC